MIQKIKSRKLKRNKKVMKWRGESKYNFDFKSMDSVSQGISKRLWDR